MKSQPFKGLQAVIPVIMTIALSACAKEIPERIGYTSVNALSQPYFEAALNIFDRIERVRAVMVDNELEPEEEGRDANFFCNPLVLNGKSLDYADFGLQSKGALSLVEGCPETPEAKKVPFRIFLRRNGVPVSSEYSDTNREVFEIEISNMLSQAKPGDYLVIVPARKSDWKAKRIIWLQGC